MTTKGLHWRHLIWLSGWTYVLIALAAASKPYELNHFLFTNTWNALAAGYPRLMKFQSQKAEELDQWSQKRYGYRTLDYRGTNCVSEFTATPPLTLQKVTQLKLAQPKSKAEAVKILGQSYCETSSGESLWLVGSEQSLIVGNSGNYQLRNHQQ